jgi:hypothetical protein
MDRWKDNRDLLAEALPAILTVTGSKVRVRLLQTSKKEQRIALKEAKETTRALNQFMRPPKLSPAEAREMRAMRARERRAAKALGSVIL